MDREGCREYVYFRHLPFLKTGDIILVYRFTLGVAEIRNSDVKQFNDLDELFEISENWIPDAERTGSVFASHPEKDDSDQVYWRDPIYTDESTPRLAGEVSSQKHHYQIHQYGDIARYLAKGIEQHEDLDPSGTILLSKSRHRMQGEIQLGKQFEPVDGDTHDLEIRFSSGHAGFYSTRYEVGAIREICSNGMKGFVSDLTFRQTHQERLNPGLAFHAVDSIVEGSEVVEKRLADAADQELVNMDESLLLLRDYGIDQYFENPTSDLLNALHSEVEDPQAPTLKETYDAATRALTHYVSDDVPEYAVDDGLERAAKLLDQNGVLPDAAEIGGQVVEKRLNMYVESDEVEPYWADEEESLRELAEIHGTEA